MEVRLEGGPDPEAAPLRLGRVGLDVADGIDDHGGGVPGEQVGVVAEPSVREAQHVRSGRRGPHHVSPPS